MLIGLVQETTAVWRMNQENSHTDDSTVNIVLFIVSVSIIVVVIITSTFTFRM